MPGISELAKVLNILAAGLKLVIVGLRHLPGFLLWLADKPAGALLKLGQGVPGLIITIGAKLAGNTFLDLLTAGAHAAYAHGMDLLAEEQRQQNEDIWQWCSEHPEAGCEPEPARFVPVGY